MSSVPAMAKKMAKEQMKFIKNLIAKIDNFEGEQREMAILLVACLDNFIQNELTPLVRSMAAEIDSQRKEAKQ